MLQLEQRTNQIIEGSAFLISGSAAVFVPKYIRWAAAVKVSRALVEYPNTMLQFTPIQLMESINKGLAVLAFAAGMKLVGFGQLWQYGFNENGQQILEFGSWLSFKKGLGEKILKEAILLGKKINPKALLVAIVEEENLKAQSILVKAGAEEIGGKFSPAIRTVEGEAAFMKIFDITKVI